MDEIDPLLDYDRKTHRYWWTWLPAHPVSPDDHWYRILRWVFADNTMNSQRSNATWRGCYTEGSEYQQTVGVFHTFSALPTLHWVERLLEAAAIAFAPPVRQVRWQYELKGKYVDRAGEGNADIALRVIDANGPATEFAVVMEAKRRGGKLKEKEMDDRYLRISHLAEFKRKFFVHLLDESDHHDELAGRTVLTWQAIARIQIGELERLALTERSKGHLLSLMRHHLYRHGIFDEGADDGIPDEKLSEGDLAGVGSQRLAALIRGAEVVVQACEGRQVRAPVPWLRGEPSIEDLKTLKQFTGKRNWYAAIW